ncbi:anti-sigma B factor RsbW [Paenibacillus sp. YN15]|uniref:anti-sigma B factor RsbW n=1 Tax=Paenibacillus sp. YN15 TaxID=1742774 RepID=UPI000DCD9CC2|nr:anti-sigma B factor RsbW [Paenibacillus sp. YN15]RAV02316.1 anti-sigma B factor RsbW [Paenibacillus sp. YN15]
MNAQKDRIVMSLPAKSQYIEVVRLALYGIAVRMGFSFEDIEDLKVAVGEACNNAVLHAYDDGEGVMKIVFEAAPRYLRIIVQDEGRSFNSSEACSRVPVTFTDKSLSEMHAGGLGLYLMQALVDDVEIRTEAGTEVILTKLLNGSGVVI